MSGTIRTQLGKAKSNVLRILDKWSAMEKTLEKERKEIIDESVKAELLNEQLYEIKGVRSQLSRAADKLQHYITTWKSFIATLPEEQQAEEQLLFEERVLKDTPNLLELVVLSHEVVQKIAKLESDLLEEARALPVSRPTTPVTPIVPGTPERLADEQPWPTTPRLVKATVSASRQMDIPDESSLRRPTTPQGAQTLAEKMIKPIAKIGEVIKQTFDVKSFSPPPGIEKVTNDQWRSDAKGHPQPKEGVGRQVCEAAAPQPQIRLPKLTMREFDGKRTEWPNFWEAFQAAVGSQNISDLYKLQYLRGLVTKKAYKAIEGYNITAENYPVVVNVLKRRFGDPTMQAQTLFAELRSMPKAGSNVMEWRNTWERISRILQQLEQVNEETQHSMVAMDILQKFPESITQFVYDKLDKRHWKDPEYILEEIDTLICRNEAAHHVQHPYEKTHHYSDRNAEPSLNVSVVTTNEKSRKGHKEQNIRQRRPRRPCIFCDEAHWSSSCSKFVSIAARKNRLRELHKCFKCFRTRESNDHKCEKTFKCFECQGDHMTALCAKRIGAPVENRKPMATNAVLYDSGSDSEEEVDFNMVQLESANVDPDRATKTQEEPVQLNSIKKSSDVALLTADAVVANTNNRNVRSTETIFFDFGSQASFVQEDLADDLNLQQLGAKKITVRPFASQAKEYNSRIVEFDIQLADGTWLTTTAFTVPDLPKSLTSAKLETDEKGKKGVKMRKHVSARILLGADNMAKVMDFPKIKGLSIVKSKLGDLVGGTRDQDAEYKVSAVTFGSVDEATKGDVEKIYALQNLGIPSSDDPYADQADDDAIKEFQKGLTYDEVTKRYTARLLYKPDPAKLSKTKKMARAQLVNLWNKLKEKPDFLKKYHDTIMTQLKSGIIEIVYDNGEESETYYIPHHAIINLNKLFPSLRVVMNASARTKFAASLNDLLRRGPVFLPVLMGVLLRIRLMENLVTADIVKAFHQIGLHPDDRDVTRFFWLRDPTLPPDESNIVVYRFTRVVFGMICSPYMLTGTVDHHLRQNGSELALKVLENIYVDNIFIEATSPQDAKEKVQQLKEMFKSASMELNEFASNDPETLAFIRTMEEVPNVVKLLGLYWTLQTDTLSVKIPKPPKEKVTKRLVLKHLAKLYDPLGFVSPIVVKVKAFLQQLFKKNCGWDDLLDDDDLETWHSTIDNWSNVEYMSVPRRILGIKGQVHIFVDASATAIAAVAYIVSEQCSEFVMSKIQVTPLKPVTIPRLELLAMLLGVKIMKILRKECFLANEVFIWSDNACVLGWLKSKKRYTRFVQNRIDTIKNDAKDATFLYVPTAENPADIGSRGKTPSELKVDEMWWKGPKFLLQPKDEWPKTAFSNPTEPQEEAIEEPSVNAVVTIEPFPVDVKRFSSLESLIRTMSFVLRFVAIIIGRQLPKAWSKLSTSGRLTTQDLSVAETLLIRRAQAETPPTKAQIENLSLTQDSKGLYRCGGRLMNAPIPTTCPIWIPENSDLATLLVLQYHKRSLHASPANTLASLRKRFWICRGRQAVKRIIRRSCLGCKRFTAHPYSLPHMPSLPQCRVERSVPFRYAAVDYAGPLRVREGQDQRKTWIALFACLTTRAIHLERVDNLSALSFINALRRFIARRGQPKTMYSDNGTNFSAAAKAITLMWVNVVQDDTVQSYCSRYAIKWLFITPLAPWQGGVYERLIGLMKNSLKHSVGHRTLTRDDFDTFLAEAEAVINDRPLTYVHSDFESLDIIRPADFLHPNCVLGAPLTGYDDDDEDYDFISPDSNNAEKLRSLWRTSLLCLDRFWKFFVERYLHELREQQRQKHRNPRSITVGEPQEGEVVIVEQDGIDRGRWPLAKITGVQRRADNAVKAVELQFADKSKKVRPVSAVIPLEVDGPKNDPKPKAKTTKNTIGEAMLFVALLAALISPSAAIRCDPNDNMARIAQQGCKENGVVIMKKLDGYLCYLNTTCPNGHLRPNKNMADLPSCGPKCECPNWATGCSFLSTTETLSSNKDNNNVKSFMASAAVPACSFHVSASCDPVPISIVATLVQLFDGSMHHSTSLQLAVHNPSIDDFLCVGEGPRSGTEEFCKHHKCTEPATQFCYYPDHDRVFLVTPAGNVLIKAWTQKRLQYYRYPDKTNLDMTCEDCFVECHVGGARVSVPPSKRLGKMEACSKGHCYSRTSPNGTIEVTLPADIVLGYFDVTVTLWSHGAKVKEMNASCGPQPFCENIQCTFCVARLTNLHCSSTIWFIAAFVVFYAVSIILLIWLRICQMSLKAVQIAVCVPVRLLQRLLPGKKKETTQPLRDDVQMEVVVDHRRPSGDYRHRSIASWRRELLTLIMFVLPLTVIACSKSTTLSARETSCTRIDNGSIECRFEDTLQISLTPIGQETCLVLKSADGTTTGSLVIRITNVAFRCQTKTDYFTRDAMFKVTSSKRCPGKGTCDDYPSCKGFTPETEVPELNDVVSMGYPGFTRCERSCGCIACGCGLCTDGCLFYRLFAVPMSHAVYKVFSCPAWTLEVTAVLVLQMQETEFTTTQVLLPGVPTQWQDATFTLLSVTTPQLPILSKTFITDGNRVAVIQGATDGISVADHIHRFTCPGQEAAKDFKCSFDYTRCPCSFTDNSVTCPCPSHMPYHLMQNDEHTLPMSNADFRLYHEGERVAASVSHSVALQMQVTVNGLTTTQQYSATTCQIEASPLEGCHSCLSASRTKVVCKTTNGKATAHVQCGSVFFSVLCSEKGTSSTITLAFAQAKIEAECVAACPGGASTFTLSGSLASVEYIKLIDNAVAKGTLRAAVPFSMPNLVNTIFSDIWHSVVLVVAVIIAVLISLFVLPRLAPYFSKLFNVVKKLIIYKHL